MLVHFVRRAALYRFPTPRWSENRDMSSKSSSGEYDDFSYDRSEAAINTRTERLKTGAWKLKGKNKPAGRRVPAASLREALRAWFSPYQSWASFCPFAIPLA